MTYYQKRNCDYRLISEATSIILALGAEAKRRRRRRTEILGDFIARSD